jgi:hypothetical protein
LYRSADGFEDGALGIVERLTAIQEWLYARTSGYRFGAVLVLLLGTFIFLSAAPPEHWAQAGSVVLESAAVLAALVASRAPRWLFVAAVIIVTLSVAGACITVGLSTDPRVPVSTFVSALLAVGVPVAIARGLWERRIVDARTVLGALSIYVSIGLFFAFIFTAIHEVTDRAFFAQNVTETSADFLYFSFVTIATVGYGDFTAAGGLGRALAALEGMTGQLYLVTVVALLVSNLRPRMSPPDGGHSPAAGDPP